MIIKTLCVALVAALALGTPLRAEPGPIGEWLMDQPVSLWDMGMTRIRQDAQRASGYLLKDAQLEGVPDAYYDWGANEIVIGLSLPFIPSCLPTTARLSGTDIILSQWIL